MAQLDRILVAKRSDLFLSWKVKERFWSRNLLLKYTSFWLLTRDISLYGQSQVPIQYSLPGDSVKHYPVIFLF